MKLPRKLLFLLLNLAAPAVFLPHSVAKEKEEPKPPKSMLPPVLELGSPKKYTPV